MLEKFVRGNALFQIFYLFIYLITKDVKVSCYVIVTSKNENRVTTNFNFCFFYSFTQLWRRWFFGERTYSIHIFKRIVRHLRNKKHRAYGTVRCGTIWIAIYARSHVAVVSTFLQFARLNFGSSVLKCVVVNGEFTKLIFISSIDNNRPSFLYRLLLTRSLNMITEMIPC